MKRVDTITALINQAGIAAIAVPTNDPSVEDDMVTIVGTNVHVQVGKNYLEIGREQSGKFTFTSVIKANLINVLKAVITTDKEDSVKIKIAHLFATELKEYLTKEEMVEVIKRNELEKDSNVCHSHDFCDANMAMDSAMSKHGLEIIDESVNPEGFRHYAEIWNAAWSIAKQNKFWA